MRTICWRFLEKGGLCIQVSKQSKAMNIEALKTWVSLLDSWLFIGVYGPS